MRWRLLFIVAFFPLAVPWSAVVFFTMIAAFFGWVITGRDCSDWIIHGPAEWLIQPLVHLMHKAGIEP